MFSYVLYRISALRSNAKKWRLRKAQDRLKYGTMKDMTCKLTVA